ncbi:hypothetical protein EDC04DRAFT_2604309 [Pisolithus marmoratus]|nr:hypothetical protein EDC04DRAFT_2604309 [Pisolithus marmoratus]
MEVLILFLVHLSELIPFDISKSISNLVEAGCGGRVEFGKPCGKPKLDTFETIVVAGCFSHGENLIHRVRVYFIMPIVLYIQYILYLLMSSLSPMMLSQFTEDALTHEDCCSVSDAQCGSETSDPPPVVAVLHPQREMAVTVLQGQQGGPDIHVPSAWQRPGKVVQLHPTDLQVQDHWMNQAYQSPSSKMISLEISALHEGGPRKGHMHGTPFGCICEGMKDIDACATTPELVTTALAKLTPKISNFCLQFLWRPSKCVVHDSSWVNLSSVPDPMQPYFYHDCLHLST